MQLAAMADYEPRMLLKTISSAPAARRAGSHAGSHTDEQPWDAPDPYGQPGETSPRSRTDLNGAERPRWYLRIRRSAKSLQGRSSRRNSQVRTDGIEQRRLLLVVGSLTLVEAVVVLAVPRGLAPSPCCVVSLGGGVRDEGRGVEAQVLQLAEGR